MLRHETCDLRIQCAGGLEAVSTVADAWRELTESSGQGPLVGPDWIAAHVAAYGLQTRFHLITAHDGEGLAAVLPLLRQTSWMRGLRVRKITGAIGYSSLRFDLVATRGERGRRAAVQLWQKLDAMPGWTCLELQPLPEGAAAETLVTCAAEGGYPVLRVPAFRSPCIDLSKGYAGALAVPKSHFRSNLRRNRRRLEALGTLRLEATTQPTAQDLEAFFAMEAAGWKGHDRDGRAVLVRPAPQRRFYFQLAASTGRMGALRLHRLWLGDRVIAASLGLVGADTYFAVKWCYDECFANYGPGHLLIEELLQYCDALNLRTFDFTGPDYDYKRDWTAAGLQHFYWYIFKPNWRGRALYSWKKRPQPRHPRPSLDFKDGTA